MATLPDACRDSPDNSRRTFNFARWTDHPSCASRAPRPRVCSPRVNAQKKPNTARPLSILIADDEPDTVATLAAILGDEGHVVHTVTHGAFVMEAVRRFKPEVCILDIEMPGQSGFGLARDIVEEHERARPLLIAITGRWTNQTDRLLAKSVGFDRFFVKPADPQELLALLDQITAEYIGTVPAAVDEDRLTTGEPKRLQVRVLIADDNRDTVLTTTALLRGEGYEVRAVYNGRDAITEIGKFDPDVVIADIKMPGLSGWELARAVRRASGFDRPVLIAISGHYKEGADRVLTNISGFNHFLPKPFDMKDLLAVLEPLKRA